MLNRRTYTRFATWVLLVAYLPVLLTSALHTHERPTAPLCNQCAHHEAHPIHFAEAQVNLQDCLLCHLMTFSYFGVAMVAAATVPLPVSRLASSFCRRVVLCPRRTAALRAPPAC